MQTDITGHHITITDALRGHVNKCLQRLLNRQKMLHNVHVVLSVDNKHHICDIVTRMGQDEFVARGDDENMYSSIDRAVEKLERQMQSAQGRKNARRGN